MQPQEIPESSGNSSPGGLKDNFVGTALQSNGFLLIVDGLLHGYESIPINTIFGGMNIHLPAIFMFTRGTRFWPTAT